jgi:hypothetical protein
LALAMAAEGKTAERPIPAARHGGRARGWLYQPFCRGLQGHFWDKNSFFAPDIP